MKADSQADTQESIPSYPPIFYSADSLAKESQRRFFISARLRLLALVLAAISGAFIFRVGNLDVFGILGAVSFGSVFILQAWMNAAKLEQSWYGGRAVAESVKTVAWRFSVCGNPFPILGSSSRDKETFLKRLSEINGDFRELKLSSAVADGAAVTEWMLDLRSRSLSVRKEFYKKDRLHEQLSWYRDKASSNRKSASRWASVLLLVDLFGMIAAVLKAASVIEFDLLGILCAIAAAGAAWLQAKQHENLSTSYSVAAHELAQILSQVDGIDNEEKWAVFVSGAEDAISREHTTWRASHSGDQL